MPLSESQLYVQMPENRNLTVGSLHASHLQGVVTMALVGSFHLPRSCAGSLQATSEIGSSLQAGLAKPLRTGCSLQGPPKALGLEAHIESTPTPGLKVCKEDLRLLFGAPGNMAAPETGRSHRSYQHGILKAEFLGAAKVNLPAMVNLQPS